MRLRWALLGFFGLTAVSLTGCGGGGGGWNPATDANVARLVGTWTKMMESTDGGASFTDLTADPAFQFTIYATGRWADSLGETGTFVLSVGQSMDVTTNVDGGDNTEELFYWQLRDGDQELWFEHTDEQNRKTGVVSLYRRQ